MIEQSENPVEWAALVTEFTEAQEHLNELIDQMVNNGSIDETDFAVRLGHIFAHLNRGWNTRRLKSEMQEDSWEAFSQFPKDLKPVG